uniref:Protein YIF1 n=1 Tax=Glossina morsitans morsitans TaxID=37546 RepID=D3TMP1_GLOMM
MNYNPNAGVRNLPGPGRKLKRVSDVNAVGPTAPSPEATPYLQSTTGPTILDPSVSVYTAPEANIRGTFNNGMHMPNPSYNYVAASATLPPQMPQYPSTGPGGFSEESQFTPISGLQGISGQFPQISMLQEPVVQDIAMQYGQRLADQGKQLVENQFSKWVPVAKLKYYFAVDNNYVIHKLSLLFFPFTHKGWSLKYDQENPVQPRYDINAPDLYIPTMAFITYVVVAGLMLGLQNRFSPEKLSIQASSALAYCIFELVVYCITLYVVNIKTSLKTLDLLAFAGYKFVTIVACLLTSTILHGLGYYIALTYCSLTLGFFLLRTLKTKVLHESAPTNPTGAINYDPYGNPQQLDYTGGRKRKLYFLFLVVGGQAFLSFLLSKHLYFSEAGTFEIKNLPF